MVSLIEEEDPGDFAEGFAPSNVVTILPMGPGEYTIFPYGLTAFAKKYKAEAVSVEDGSVYVLREGLVPGRLKWVDLVEEP